MDGRSAAIQERPGQARLCASHVGVRRETTYSPPPLGLLAFLTPPPAGPAACVPVPGSPPCPRHLRRHRAQCVCKVAHLVRLASAAEQDVGRVSIEMDFEDELVTDVADV